MTHHETGTAKFKVCSFNIDPLISTDNTVDCNVAVNRIASFLCVRTAEGAICQNVLSNRLKGHPRQQKPVF